MASIVDSIPSPSTANSEDPLLKPPFAVNADTMGDSTTKEAMDRIGGKGALIDLLRSLEERVRTLEANAVKEGEVQTAIIPKEFNLKSSEKDMEWRPGKTDTSEKSTITDDQIKMRQESEEDREKTTGQGKTLDHGRKVDSSERYSLQTAFYDSATEPDPYFLGAAIGGNFITDGDGKHLVKALFTWNVEPVNTGDDSPPSPEHIDILALRLTSKPLAEFLNARCSHKIDRYGLILLTKPFRLLVRHASAIKNYFEQQSFMSGFNSISDSCVEEVARKQGDQDKPENSTNTENGITPPDPSCSESDETLQHFKVLTEFLEKYLGRQLDLYTSVRSGKQPRLAFEDLWMLYEAEETIVSPFRKGGQKIFHYGDDEEEFFAVRRDVPQAYRMLASSGGIPLSDRLTPPKANELSSAPPLSSIWVGNRVAQLQPHYQKAKEKYSPLYLYCYFIDRDVAKFTVRTDAFVLRPFDGEVEITSLEVYPLKYFQEQPVGSSYQRLLSRGRSFIDYTVISHCNYEDLTLGESPEQIKGPLIIDFEQALHEGEGLILEPKETNFFWARKTPATVMEIPRTNCTTCAKPNCSFKMEDIYKDQQKNDSSKSISRINAILDEFLLDGDRSQMEALKKEMEKHGLLELLPGAVYGFALRDRKWRKYPYSSSYKYARIDKKGQVQFDIELLKQAQTDDDETAWDDLVLPKNHRAMVQSMVETHSVSGTKVAGAHTFVKSEIGLVQGKGKGCIILLHGVPGVGKTSTAECVAAYTKRPLFPITCGDIGYEPAEVERNLQRLFRLAHRWGCVLLIDEADVFLAERDKSDVKRNGLVSVFLRILEYYSGILFLTTNRVGAFDDAFRSRIHLTLYYPKLDQKQSRKVWKTNMKRIDRMNEERVKNGLPQIETNNDRLLQFAERNYDILQWNGRQIQNAFQTALALSQFEVRDTPSKSPEITVNHFKTIADASIQFETYLHQVHLGNEAKIAMKKSLRADEAKLKVREVQLPTSGSESGNSSEESSEAEKKRKKRAKQKRRAKEARIQEEETDDEPKSKKKLLRKKDSQKIEEPKRKSKTKKRTSKSQESTTEAESSNEYVSELICASPHLYSYRS